MSKLGRRYLWACAGAGTLVCAWTAWQWYKWSTIDWDKQEAAS